MTGEAYAQSARVARDHGGPFEGYEKNREPMLRVMRKHRNAIKAIDRDQRAEGSLRRRQRAAWDDAVEIGEQHGYRNAQATVLAPTGTIGFMMDCDTTGVEPDIALVKYKKLVGGGLIQDRQRHRCRWRSTSSATPRRRSRKSSPTSTSTRRSRARRTSPPTHLPVFDCAFKALKGDRSIHYMGHIKMMGAVQPFISGAISKTVNVPKDATVDEIQEAYVQSWRLGAKAVSIYRDGSKRTQPLNTSKDKQVSAEVVATGVPQPVRRRLPDERPSITHRFDIAGHEGYITVGLFEDGQPGEIFLVMAKEGSTISGFADAFAQAISYALQYGVPLQVLVDKFSHARFEPSGMTRNPEVRFAKSIVDYVFRWMATKFLSPEARYRAGVNMPDPSVAAVDAPANTAVAATIAAATAGSKGTAEFASMQNQEDAPPCTTCGSIMVRSGACYKCANCGTTSGCG